MVQTCSYFSCERSGLGKTIITKTNRNLEENESTKNGFLDGEYSFKQKGKAASFPISHPQRETGADEETSARKGRDEELGAEPGFTLNGVTINP
jgi:hypothetical protein